MSDETEPLERATGDRSPRGGEVARGEEPAPGADDARPSDDATRLSDIRYYRQSLAARRLTLQAVERARRARREAIALLPLVAGVVLLWRYRESLFGTDVPIRVAAAVLLAAFGWRLARDLGRVLGPRLLGRFDSGTASTISFLVQLGTIFVVAVVAFRIVDVDTRTIAVGGAVTAVVLGLAAQSTLGNVIAGIVLLASRPFSVGDRVRLQGGPLGGPTEGTVVSLGLIHTTLARGGGTILVPNSVALGSTIVPLHEPAGIDLRARLRVGVKPSDLQRMLAQGVCTPTRDRPHIALEEVYGDGALVRVTATPIADADGSRLADEVLAVLSQVAAETR